MPANPPSIEPIRRSTLGAEVTDRLRALVIGGAFAPGTVLSEVDLAARFGVSRGPVREALLHLLQEGLLRREPRRGLSVPIVGEDDSADLHLARHAIEAEALRVVLERRPDGLAAELRTILADMTTAAEKGDWLRMVGCDIAFHTAIVRAADSPRLARMWSLLADETRAHLSLADRHPDTAGMLREHVEIAGLLSRGDRVSLLRAAAAHASPRDGSRQLGAPGARRPGARWARQVDVVVSGTGEGPS